MRIILGLMLCILLSNCSSSDESYSNSIVGTWAYYGSELYVDNKLDESTSKLLSSVLLEDDANTLFDYEFNSDGTIYQRLNYISLYGKYSVINDRILVLGFNKKDTCEFVAGIDIMKMKIDRTSYLSERIAKDNTTLSGDDKIYIISTFVRRK